MLNRRRVALAIAVGLVLIPAAAWAADTESRFGKNRGTNPGVSFDVVKPAERGSAVVGSTPRRGGGLSNAVRTPARLFQSSLISIVGGRRSACSGAAAGGVSDACRATAPDATPAGLPGVPTTVDAPRLAERAAGQLDLPTPTLNTSPADPVKTLVGLQTWLWVPAAQWQTLTASASAGGATVTVTAEPIQSRWDMGEGAVNCAGPGREWRKGLGQNARTDCGYTYKRTSLREPDNKYAVAATLRYQITWACEGDCSEDAGDLGTLDSPTSTSQLEVSERQSVVIR